MIRAKVVADSLNVATKDRITTFLLVYPRYIHGEVMTHRMFSRNAASSRAIPTKKFREDVANSPVMPQHWSANQKGMQADSELNDLHKSYKWCPGLDIDDSQLPTYEVTARGYAERVWLRARDEMLVQHEALEAVGLHKQIANRILEPWFHIQLLVTATEYKNFFALRSHSDAHPDIQALSDAMLYHYMTNEPVSKEPGDWHLPFGDQDLPKNISFEEAAKVCTARAARVSYKTFEGVINLEEDMKLHDRLMSAGHWSPFEHPAKAMKYATWSGNFRGWQQYRKEFAQEHRTPDLQELWEQRKKAGSTYAMEGQPPAKLRT